MRKEYRQLSPRELASITSGRLVVSRIPPPERSSDNASRKVATEGECPSHRTGGRSKKRASMIEAACDGVAG